MRPTNQIWVRYSSILMLMMLSLSACGDEAQNASAMGTAQAGQARWENRPVDASGPSVPAGVPHFAVDPFWPKPMPNNWILGQVAGLDIDADGLIWLIHRPWTAQGTNAGSTPRQEDRGNIWGHEPLQSLCCTTAPPVIAFDAEGNVVHAWGGSTAQYDWFNSEHGIHVDHNGYVWVAGNGTDDHHMLKFTKDGQFVLQIGAVGVNQGSHDTNSVNRPAIFITDPDADELYIADGYGNRRLIVFDSETGEYKRHWGAYGETPIDENPGPYDPAAPPSRTWRQPVHAVIIDRDGLVYVSDRPSNRIQVFQKDGTYLREAFLAPNTYGPGAPWDFAWDPTDPNQRFLYVPDGTNNKVWILDRQTLEVVHSWGRGRISAGDFDWLHNLRFDASGNIYTAEVQTGHRIQKFNRIAN
jgi:DNA-binding beta-propeller fold protein YncE